MSGDCGFGDEGCIDGDGDLLSGDGERGPSDLGEGGDLGGDFASFLELSLLSEEELRLLRELELLLLDDDCASPLPSLESSESIPENRYCFLMKVDFCLINTQPRSIYTYSSLVFTTWF